MKSAFRSNACALSARIFRSLVVLPVLAWPTSACSSGTPPRPTDPAPAEIPVVDGNGLAGSISVFADKRFQTIDGFGTSQRLFDDPHLNGEPPTASTGGLVMTAAQRGTIYDLLYSPTKGIGLNRLRMGLTWPGWQPEEGVRIVPDAPYPGPHATAALDFIKNALKRNPDLQTGFQIPQYDNWVDNNTPPRIIAQYVKSALDFAKERGHEPKWVGVQNEPSLTKFTGDKLRDIIVALKLLLDADGRYSTKVSAPDDVTDELGTPKTATILADPTARSFVSALSIHLYGNPRPVGMARLASQYNLPLWMTEYDSGLGSADIGWASEIVHEMLVTYNCSAVDMLLGFLAAVKPGNEIYTYISLKSQGTSYLGYTLNPSYFQIGHWSRYVTRGSVRIDAKSTNSDLKVSAFTKSGKTVLVVINTGAMSTGSMAVPSGTYRMIRTRMKGTDRLTDKGLVKSAVLFPGESVTTLLEQ